MDLWGHCSECARWFYMSTESALCPVCRQVPASVEDRDEHAAERA